MTVTERPLFGKAEVQRLTDVWVEKRRNFHRNPVNGGTVTGGLATGNSAYNTGGTTGTYEVSAGWQRVKTTGINAGGRNGFWTTVPLTGATAGTVVNFRVQREAGYALPAGIRARLYIDAVAANGSTIVGHYDGYFKTDALSDVLTASLTPIADAATLRWYIWLEPNPSTGSFTGTAQAGFAWATVEVGVPVGEPFYGFGFQTTTPDSTTRTQWSGTPYASAPVVETRRVNFIKNATQVSYRRGGARAGIGTKTDVGLLTFTLHNDEDPLNGGTFQPGQEVRLAAGTYTPERTVVHPAETVYSYGFENYKEHQEPGALVPAQTVYTQGFEFSAVNPDGWSAPSGTQPDSNAYTGGGHTGTFYMWASGSSAYVERTMTGLTVGREYTATAWGRPLTGSSNISIGVAGLSQGASVTAPTTAWTQATYTFTATATSHVLRLFQTGVGSRCWDDVTLTRNAYSGTPTTVVDNNGLDGWSGSVTDDLAHTGMYCLGGADNARTFTGLIVGRSYTLRWWEWNGSNAWVAKSQAFTATATSMVRTLPGFLPKDDVTLTRDAWTETIPAVSSGDPIFTGRVVDVKSTYPLNKATGQDRTSVTVTVADAVNIHGGTMRYGVQIAEGFETFESRINRLASSALAPIQPPVQGAPKVVYSF